MIMPTKEGLYRIKCGEGNYEWEFVAISRRDGLLVVHDRDLGIVLLEYFHNGLTGLEWEFVA